MAKIIYKVNFIQYHRIMSKEYENKVMFHIRVWRFYKKLLKRRINTLIKAWIFHKAQQKRKQRTATFIQLHWKKYKTQKRMVIRIQSAIRRFMAMKKYRVIKVAIKRIQRTIRLYLHKKIHNAAITIQRFMQTL